MREAKRSADLKNYLPKGAPERQWKNPQFGVSLGCACQIDQMLLLKLPAGILISFQPQRSSQAPQGFYPHFILPHLMEYTL